VPPLLPLGSSLRGRYRIHRTLHQSRLRNLYIAEDQHLRGKFWVVKEMQPVGVDHGDRARLLAMFQAEALQVSALEHPHLPKLVDFFSQEGCLYLIREFIPGTDLATVLQTRGSLTETETLRIGTQLCDLLAYLWARKLPSGIHRDLRLSNMVLTEDGQIKVLDIGFGRLLGGRGSESMGAPDYAAPEQFTGEAGTDTRTLVYNVGALMYHMLTGMNPGSSPFNLTPIEELRPGMATVTRSILTKALKNHPAERPGSLQELRRGLDKALAAATRRPGHPLESSERSQEFQNRNGSGGGAWAWILGMLLMALMGGALVVLYQMFLDS
jgi:serine/threonine-protein kinase